MTFDFANFDPRPPLCEETYPRYESRAGYEPVWLTDYKPVNATAVERTGKSGFVTAHIEKANTCLDNGAFDDAYDALAKATERTLSNKQQVRAALDKAIAKLTTVGTRASHPHPKAIKLVRLRRGPKCKR